MVSDSPGARSGGGGGGTPSGVQGTANTRGLAALSLAGMRPTLIEVINPTAGHLNRVAEEALPGVCRGGVQGERAISTIPRRSCRAT